MKDLLNELNKKIIDERETMENIRAKMEKAEPRLKDYYSRVHDYHMGVAHGLEIAREEVIKKMK